MSKIDFERSYFYDYSYELYKLDWLERISLKTLRKTIGDYYKQREWYTDINDYLWENGYDGEMYADYDEFMDNEFEDDEFMKSLLTEDMFEYYLILREGE